MSFNFAEVRGDLFSVGGNVSLAHCISVDCRMGKGIAVAFKTKFGGVGELKAAVAAGAGVGSALVLKRGARHVFYLLTKERATDKPTYDDLEAALVGLAEEVESRGVVELAMPRIGCGLDGLKWGRVSALIQDVFKDADLDLTVYYQ